MAAGEEWKSPKGLTGLEQIRSVSVERRRDTLPGGLLKRRSWLRRREWNQYEHLRVTERRTTRLGTDQYPS